MYIGTIKDGAVVNFENSANDYMKVCDRNGIGGVVNIATGEYIAIKDLEQYYEIDPNTATEINILILQKGDRKMKKVFCPEILKGLTKR